VLSFADFGNSPFNFTADKVQGRSVVYSTTNGTGIMNRASDCHDKTFSILSKSIIFNQNN